MNNRKSKGILRLSRISLFAAFISATSLIQIPIGTVPVTMQLFGIYLALYTLGGLDGTVSVAVYISLGLVGLPVFSGYMGGFSAFFGPTGGFIAGFFPLALLAGFGRDKKPFLTVLLGVAGLILCHIMGAGHYKIVTGCSIATAFVTVSLPYIIKDIALIVGAYFLSLPIKKRIMKK